MSKVICDVCGTSYPETSTQCPICGCVRPADSVVSEDTQQEGSGYTYVKGGRFSKSNVKKRNHGVEPQKVTQKKPAKDKKPINKKLIGLVIVVSCLVLIFGLFAWFIYGKLSSNKPTTPEVTESVDIPCTGLIPSHRTFEITDANQILNLSVTRTPSNTTDQVTFESTNPDIVMVDQKTGNVTYVSNGKADIIIRCGAVQEICTITCNVPVVEEPTEPDVTEPTEPVEQIRFLTTLIQTTDYFQCEPNTSYTLYVGQVPHNEIRWYSDNPDIAEFRDGVVYMKANGTTTVYAEYGDQKLSCTVIVGSGDGYNLLTPDTDIDLADYKYWCQYYSSGWAGNFSETWVEADNRIYQSCIDITISNEALAFGLYNLETEAEIVLSWRPVYAHDSVKYDEETKVFTRDREQEQGKALYYAQYGDETIFLYIR